MCFFFNDTATTEIYTLSLHDALPICAHELRDQVVTPAAAALLEQVDEEPLHAGGGRPRHLGQVRGAGQDRKSTRLNSSHANISYAVFCLKKKKKHLHQQTARRHNPCV